MDAYICVGVCVFVCCLWLLPGLVLGMLNVGCSVCVDLLSSQSDPDGRCAWHGALSTLSKPRAHTQLETGGV